MTAPSREFDRLFEELGLLSSSPADLLLQGAGNILGGAHSIEQLVEAILDRAIQNCGAARGFVLLDADGDNYHFFTARKPPSSPLLEPWKLVSNTIVQQAMSTRVPIYSRDASKDPALSAIHSVQHLEIRSIVCAPLIWMGRALGAIYIESSAGRLGEHERVQVEELAEKAATVLGILLTVQNYQKMTDSLRQEVQWLQRRTNPIEAEPTIVGRSEAMRNLRAQAMQVANEDLSVLIVGETGTGKDLFARWIHEMSPRRGNPFVAVNCAAIQDSLAESELFGHTRGAFTGAISARPGRVEQAEDGTLFLDEIGDMSPHIQAKILRLLENNEYFRLGDDRPRKAHIRVIAATNRNLDSLMAEGRFRQDLFYRLDQYRLALPPLRDRPEDIQPLAEHFLRRSCAGRPPALEGAALEDLRRHNWPGNIRELGHVLRRCLVGLPKDAAIDAERLRPHLHTTGAPLPSTTAAQRSLQEVLPLRDMLAKLEREYLQQVLSQYPDASRVELAERLDVPLRTFQERLRALGLSRTNKKRV